MVNAVNTGSIPVQVQNKTRHPHLSHAMLSEMVDKAADLAKEKFGEIKDLGNVGMGDMFKMQEIMHALSTKAELATSTESEQHRIILKILGNISR